jgi:hypothetical protein
MVRAYYSPKPLYAAIALVTISVLTLHSNIDNSNSRRLEVIQSERTIVQSISHAFEPWNRNEQPFPCTSKDSPTTQGIFYIKVPKTSSSTLAGITNRIAGREAKRQSKEVCKTYDPMVHQKAMDLRVGDRDKTKSFLWTVVRQPADRLISHYGMKIDHGQVAQSESSFIRHVKTGMFPPNMQLAFLDPNEEELNNGVPEHRSKSVQTILNEYNFIGV